MLLGARMRCVWPPHLGLARSHLALTRSRLVLTRAHLGLARSQLEEISDETKAAIQAAGCKGTIKDGVFANTEGCAVSEAAHACMCMCTHTCLHGIHVARGTCIACLVHAGKCYTPHAGKCCHIHAANCTCQLLVWHA